jgi:uncharacterized protein YkwD
MKVRLAGLFMLCCAIVLLISFPGSDHSRSQTTKVPAATGLSSAEQDLLNEINQARAQPQVYAAYLEKLKPLFSGKDYKPSSGATFTTEEGWGAVDEAIKFLRIAKPIEPLTTSKGLCLAAVAHVKDQGSTGSTGHQSANNTLIEQRVKPFGAWQGVIGENLTYGDQSARERLLAWLIDDGFASRGHRKRLMSSDYRVSGISCGPHPQFGSMCVLELAGGFTDLQAPTSATNKNSTPASKTRRAKPRAHRK